MDASRVRKPPARMPLTLVFLLSGHDETTAAESYGNVHAQTTDRYCCCGRETSILAAKLAFGKLSDDQATILHAHTSS